MNKDSIIIPHWEKFGYVWDPDKCQTNQEKHGVSFGDIEALWFDPYLVVLPAKKRGERRLMAIGEVHACIFSAVYTVEGMTIRIISARLASEKERRLYYEQKKRYENR